jgi:hypothetical protein
MCNSNIGAKMGYDRIKNLKDSDFKRLVGVEKSTFKMMVSILRSEERKRLKNGGKKARRIIENRLLMALEYWREYRTYFHVGQNYGYSESQTFKIIRWIENTLIKCGKFALPGKKQLLKSDIEYEVVLVDATESPCERPKKSSDGITQARKRDTHKRHKSL